VDPDVEGPQQGMATIVLLHYGGGHTNGHQGLGRRMEDYSPHLRHTCRGRGGGGKTGTYTCSGGRARTETSPGSHSAQETKDRPEKTTT
jgi:hypothetical protein